ncbi:MAG: glycosyltransferase family 39 protein [Acidobacteriia bacterium]|nr:glycosyltransferase family 39 protein [Terriglobia bacterium]
MTARPRAPARAASRGERLAAAAPWAIVALAVILVLAMRVRLMDLPLERDEGEYAYAGQMILEGHVPYGDMDNMKLPGTYYAYALFMALLGQSPRGIHFGLALWTTVSALLLFAVGRRLLDPLAGAIAAAVFAILSASFSVLGFAGHATHFVVLPVLAGCWGILWPGRRERLGLLAAGLAFGLAFLMKQQAAAFVLFGVLFVLWRSRSAGWRSAALKGLLFSLGAAAPYAVLCAYLASKGVFANFWFWTVTYARDYVGEVPITDAGAIFLDQAGEVTGWYAGAWALAAAGAIVYFIRGKDRDTKVFLAGLTILSFAAVCPGFFFREHYFIVMLPAVGLLTGAGYAALPSGRAGGEGPGWTRALYAIACFAALLAGGVAQAAPVFKWDMEHVSRRCYGINPFPESIEIGRYIDANSAPADRIAVLGSEPEIYFYAHRRSASRYLYVYALMEPHPYAGRLQDQVIEEIEAARPRIVVLVRVGVSWLGRPDSDKRIMRWMDSYLPAHYDVTGLAQMSRNNSTRYLWGPEAAAAAGDSHDDVLVMKRRD